MVKELTIHFQERFSLPVFPLSIELINHVGRRSYRSLDNIFDLFVVGKNLLATGSKSVGCGEERTASVAIDAARSSPHPTGTKILFCNPIDWRCARGCVCPVYESDSTLPYCSKA